MNKLKEKFHLNITNIMFWLSSAFIISCVIGMIMSLHVSRKVEDNNYLFSDKADMVLFETALNNKEIPYKQISDTTISIHADWNDLSEEVYQDCFNKETAVSYAVFDNDGEIKQLYSYPAYQADK